MSAQLKQVTGEKGLYYRPSVIKVTFQNLNEAEQSLKKYSEFSNIEKTKSFLAKFLVNKCAKE